MIKCKAVLNSAKIYNKLFNATSLEHTHPAPYKKKK